MTQRQFEVRIRNLLEQALERTRKRIAKLESAAKGAGIVATRVRVKPHWVPRHHVRAHYRLSYRRAP